MSAPQMDVDAAGELQEQRRALVQHAGQLDVTLDGKPALLLGWALRQAAVCEVRDGSTTDGAGHMVHEVWVDWDRVPYILEHGGAFAS